MKVYKSASLTAAVALIGALSLSACATTDYVDKKVAGASSDLSGRQDQLKADLSGQISAQDGRITAADRTAHEALDRAIAAGKATQGKFVYGVVLNDASAHFPTDSSKLSDETKAKLTDFAARLKTENKNVFIEIQGYTDNRGSAAGNLRLGSDRAEAVRRFLNTQGVALNRISTISYGEENPVAPNKTRDGRAQNRRVVLIVVE
jgi:outer membrane protein OmpA-like peptidoglycan-associated protein